MSRSIVWSGTLTALSSVAHGGETRGTITLLRRELVAQPDGAVVPVPIISGNSIRGRLRRIGEELMRDTLGYEGQIPMSAAHALRGGGSLAKVSGEPLSGSRLRQLRELIPHLGVFGAAAGGRIIDGALQVGKALPLVAETNRITGAGAARSAFEATQIETYTRQDDSLQHPFSDLAVTDSDSEPGTDRQMLYRLETFPAGTTFGIWIRLVRATELEHAFFCDVLAAYAEDGLLGGRTAIGHGRVSVDLTSTPALAPVVDWRSHVAERREEALLALQGLR